MNFDAAKWVDYLAEKLGPLQLTPQTRQTLIDYVNAAGEFQENGMNGLAQPGAPVQNIADVQPAFPTFTPAPRPGFNRVTRPNARRLRARLRRRPQPPRPRRPGRPPARRHPADDGHARIPGLLNL